jgi:hypothetical protein
VNDLSESVGMRETTIPVEAAGKRSTQQASESSDDLQSFLQEIRDLNNGGAQTGLRTPVTYRDWLWPVISGTVILLGLVGVAFLVLQVLAWPTWSWYACGGTTGAALLVLGIRVDGKRLRQLST